MIASLPARLSHDDFVGAKAIMSGMSHSPRDRVNQLTAHFGAGRARGVR